MIPITALITGALAMASSEEGTPPTFDEMLKIWTQPVLTTMQYHDLLGEGWEILFKGYHVEVIAIDARRCYEEDVLDPISLEAAVNPINDVRIVWLGVEAEEEDTLLTGKTFNHHMHDDMYWVFTLARRDEKPFTLEEIRFVNSKVRKL